MPADGGGAPTPTDGGRDEVPTSGDCGREEGDTQGREGGALRHRQLVVGGSANIQKLGIKRGGSHKTWGLE